MNLSEWLQGQNMKQTELAERIGVSDSVVSRVCNDKRPPSAELWRAFARVYGMAQADAVFGNGHAPEAVEAEA